MLYLDSILFTMLRNCRMSGTSWEALCTDMVDSSSSTCGAGAAPRHMGFPVVERAAERLDSRIFPDERVVCCACPTRSRRMAATRGGAADCRESVFCGFFRSGRVASAGKFFVSRACFPVTPRKASLSQAVSGQAAPESPRFNSSIISDVRTLCGATPAATAARVGAVSAPPGKASTIARSIGCARSSAVHVLKMGLLPGPQSSRGVSTPI